MSYHRSPKFFITRLEPTKFKNVLYGKQVEFNREKHFIRFHSEFHESGYLQFTQIKKLEILYDKKRKLLWWAICTFFLGIGIFLFIVRIRLPPWRIRIWMKNKEEPIKIRAWMREEEANDFYLFANKLFPTKYLPKS